MPEGELRQRQLTFFLKEIEYSSHDSAYMRFLFEIVQSFSEEEERIRILTKFVECNRSYADFEALSLEPWHYGWVGSEVPVLQGRIDYFRSLLPIFNTVDLLQHRLKIEKCIQRCQEAMERAKREDFVDEAL